MKITCPQCNAQNLIFGIAVSCVVCGSILVGRHDDLPHQNFPTQPINTFNMVASGSATGSTVHTTSLTDIKWHS
jgi:hypothetical protein